MLLCTVHVSGVQSASPANPPSGMTLNYWIWDLYHSHSSSSSSLCLQLSRGWCWLQMNERESSMRRRGTSLRATLKRRMMVYLMRAMSSFTPPAAHSSTKILIIFPEQNERSRESTEQWREFHYDGMHPPYEYNRQSIWGERRCCTLYRNTFNYTVRPLTSDLNSVTVETSATESDIQLVLTLVVFTLHWLWISKYISLLYRAGTNN